MTRLIVRPLDPTAPGSYLERQRLLGAVLRIKKAVEKGDLLDAIEAQTEAEAALVSHLVTDDGSPIEDVLSQLSANQFDELFQGLVSGNSVGEVSGGNSKGRRGAIR